MNIWSIVGDISNVVATGLAALSIYFTIKEYKLARKFGKSQMVIEQKFLWYNELMLHEVVSSINDMIEYSKIQMEDCKSKKERAAFEANLQESYQKIKEKTKVTEEKVYILKVFSEKLYRECHALVQKIFDLYSTAFNEASVKKYIYVDENRLQKTKTEIFRILYQELDKFMEDGNK